jgi:predicted regulator of Ras-like GTPase activity (Roadblock/LC7/MglB family)
MPFRSILRDLVENIDGAVGAMFLDWDGEAVELFSNHHGRYDLHLVGAYQGIFLNQLDRAAGELAMGRIEFFKLGCSEVSFFNCTLTDGYYLVLITDRRTPEWLAWERLRMGRDRLLEEM